MKITKLIAIFSFVLASFTTYAETLYSAPSTATTGFNAGSSRITFNEMLIDGSIMGMNNRITLSQIKVTIVRVAGAPATDVNLWIGVDDGSGSFDISKIGTTQSLISSSTTTTQVVTFGNGSSVLHTTGVLNLGGELSIGIEFTNPDSKNSWQFAGPPESPNSPPNSNFARVYSSTVPYTLKAAAPITPPTYPGFALQMFGNPGTTLLPIELAKFNATQTDKFQSTLTWQTASEKNNQGFQIEKSLDGSVFKSIGFVKGVGNSNVSNDYDFRDNDFSKSAYFRLKQIDFDGKYSYSPTVYVEKSQVGKVKTLVYPNPSLGKFYVDHATDIKNITVFNLTGQAVFNQNINEAERTEIDISNLATGLYFVRLNDNKGHIETKQVKIVSQ
jgi:Secretion system C-terminal sorting domain